MVQSGEWINGIQGGQDPGTFVRSLTAKTSHVIHLHVIQSLHDIIRGKAEACNFKLLRLCFMLLHAIDIVFTFACKSKQQKTVK